LPWAGHLPDLERPPEITALIAQSQQRDRRRQRHEPPDQLARVRRRSRGGGATTMPTALPGVAIIAAVLLVSTPALVKIAAE
jgi:hypothetical protein